MFWGASRDVKEGEELTFKYDWPSGDECLVSYKLWSLSIRRDVKSKRRGEALPSRGAEQPLAVCAPFVHI